MKTPFVYFVRCGRTNYYKIGYTIDVMKRLNVIQVNLPQQVILIAAFQSNQAKDLEIQLHCKYKKNRVRGEWFKFNKTEANKIELGFKANGNQLPIHFSSKCSDT